jgi:hypothetical protein
LVAASPPAPAEREPQRRLGELEERLDDPALDRAVTVTSAWTTSAGSRSTTSLRTPRLSAFRRGRGA